MPRFAGVAYVFVNGNRIPVHGNLTVSPSTVSREMIAGQDGVQGYREMPRVPYIQVDCSTRPEISTETLDADTDVTVQADLANGRSYVLRDAVCQAGLEINTADGTFRIRWDGEDCQEIS